jgi:type IV secretion system protein VirD4
MLFKKQKEVEPMAHLDYAVESGYGRALTSIASAKNELFKEIQTFNPSEYLIKNHYFLGLDLQSKKPFYNQEAIHTQIVAPTRSGKGVFIGLKVVEALREGKGIVVIDPKEDDFLPQVILEELERQNRIGDFQIVNWPNNFGYTVFDDFDSVEEATKKMTIMLDLIENPNEIGASFYKKSERIVLYQVMKAFFNAEELLKVKFEKTLFSLSIIMPLKVKTIFL